MLRGFDDRWPNERGRVSVRLEAGKNETCLPSTLDECQMLAARKSERDPDVGVVNNLVMRGRGLTLICLSFGRKRSENGRKGW